MIAVQHDYADVRGGAIANSGHWVAEEAPQFVAAELLKFFAEDRSDPLTPHKVAI